MKKRILNLSVWKNLNVFSLQGERKYYHKLLLFSNSSMSMYSLILFCIDLILRNLIFMDKLKRKFAL